MTTTKRSLPSLAVKDSDLQAAAVAGVTGYLFEATGNLTELIGRILKVWGLTQFG